MSQVQIRFGAGGHLGLGTPVGGRLRCAAGGQLPLLAQNAVDGGFGRQVLALVGQPRHDLLGGPVGKLGTVDHRQDPRPLIRGEGVGGGAALGRRLAAIGLDYPVLDPALHAAQGQHRAGGLTTGAGSTGLVDPGDHLLTLREVELTAAPSPHQAWTFFLEQQQRRRLGQGLVLTLQLAAQVADLAGLLADLFLSGAAGRGGIGGATALPPGLHLLDIEALRAAILAQLVLVQASGLDHDGELDVAARSRTGGWLRSGSRVDPTQSDRAPAVQGVLRDLRLPSQCRDRFVVGGQHAGDQAVFQFLGIELHQ